MPVPACESLAIPDTSQSYFTDAEVEGEKTKHLHGELVINRNQELWVSWLPVLGSGSNTGLPFLLVGTTANTSALTFTYRADEKITICWEGSEMPTSHPLVKATSLKVL